MKLTIPSFESAFRGLAAALPTPADLPPADGALAAAATIVFGSGRLVPSYRESYETWYPSLKKPVWTPPGWVFPCVWIPLKAAQSAGLARLLAAASAAGWSGPSLLPIGVYLLHSGLGNAWNVVHFGRRQLGKSVAVMAGVWGSALATAVAWHKADPAAGRLFAPTCVWLTIAAALNVSITRMNGGFGGKKNAE
jgi:translocator protein